MKIREEISEVLTKTKELILKLITWKKTNIDIPAKSPICLRGDSR